MKFRLLALTAALLLAVAPADGFARDRDNNPPGKAGGKGTNWENPRGPAGGPGASPDRRHRDRDGNPPGPAGGPGTNWENPPGPAGGPGASPDRTFRWGGPTVVFVSKPGGFYFHQSYGYWHPVHGFWHQAGRCWRDPDWNPPGPVGGPGTNWENPPGLAGGPGASPDRFGRCR
jgi:hypothetical protein